MGREVDSRKALRRLPLCAAVVMALSSSAVMAAEPAATNSDGFVHFDLVRIVNAPATTSPASSSQSAMRTYKDSVTGELRGPTTEEMQAVATDKPAAKFRANDSRMRPYALANGGVRVQLDESALQYSVIVRQPDGSLAEVCVTGLDTADQVANNPVLVKAAPRKDVTNDR
jgi:hypothetical protein